jgi:hypothetical protein
MLSQASWQQYGSAAQTLAAQGLHDGGRLLPDLHSVCSHASGPQICHSLHVPEQQGPASGAHASPAATQVAVPQVPALHGPLQHTVCASQAEPSGAQAPHTPAEQAPEQHVLGSWHAAPSRVHAPVQTPPEHMALQQSEPFVQAACAGRHAPVLVLAALLEAPVAGA